MFEIVGICFEYVWKFFRVLEKFLNRFGTFPEHLEIMSGIDNRTFWHCQSGEMTFQTVS